MNNKKEDRRVLYTKMVLKDSFINLLEEKNISKITIKEICADADINRATFYTHYNDQYDLMEKIQDELLENIASYLEEYTSKEVTTVPVDTVERIFAYLKDNARLCKLLLGEKGDLNFQKRVFTLVYDKNISVLTRSGAISPQKAEYIYAFTLTGCVGAIQRWLNNDMQETPQFMAEIIIRLATGLPSLMAD